MIVYGDPSSEQPLSGTRGRLLAMLRDAAGNRLTLDGLRRLLIAAGQLEQGAEDAERMAQTDLHQFRAATDHLAAAFVRCFGRLQGTTPVETVDDLERAAGLIAGATASPDRLLRIKEPEGFAFYALSPEQHHLAAEQWWIDHQADAPRRAAVVGIRSIGTTLSAIVSATLRSRGWDARRFTVRPTGHPFARECRIDPAAIEGCAHALVVDEGPGASGSSMAAVGAALDAAGIDLHQVSVFPGHLGEPGPQASAEVRDWWSSTRRYVVPLQSVRWSGRTLMDVLAADTLALCGGQTSVARLQDLGGGLWREVVWPNASAAQRSSWPPAYALFERPKCRVVLADGRSVLWKFHGLTEAGDMALARLAHLADEWTARPLGIRAGFIATEWMDGMPLTRADATPSRLAHVGRYIRTAAGAPLSLAEALAGFGRLREMLEWNTRASLGDDRASRARQLADAVAASVTTSAWPSYGDGRLAPHEWLRTSGGTILKTDCTGHDADHTMVGRQPVLWDVAGAEVEWGIEDDSPMAALRVAAGTAPASLLRFYRAAYAAFRLGMCSMCRGSADPAERARLDGATEFFRKRLDRELSGSG